MSINFRLLCRALNIESRDGATFCILRVSKSVGTILPSCHFSVGDFDRGQHKIVRKLVTNATHIRHAVFQASASIGEAESVIWFTRAGVLLFLVVVVELTTTYPLFCTLTPWKNCRHLLHQKWSYWRPTPSSSGAFSPRFNFKPFVGQASWLNVVGQLEGAIHL